MTCIPYTTIVRLRLGELRTSSVPTRFLLRDGAEYHTLDMSRAPKVNTVQFSSYTDRTAATQLLMHPKRDAVSGFFNVANPTGISTMDSPTWGSGWHAPLLILTKASIHAGREDTQDLHRLVDDLFSQIQKRLNSGAN